MSILIHRHKVRNQLGAVKNTAPTVTPDAVSETPDEATEPIPDAVSETPDEAQDKKYSKTDINRASVDTLKEIAAEVGIEDADDKTGGELKKLIIEQLGL